MKLTLYVCLALALLSGGCVHHQPVDQTGITRTPERLGRHAVSITTRSPEAQRAFNRGLNWTYAFAHHAAEQEFRRAASADPECAMAHWGIALVNGPHINFPMVPPARATNAWEALQRARQLAPQASPLEQALIGALSARYANPQPEDRSPLDQAYAEAMGEVWRNYPGNADVGSLYAESLMDLHPWDLWTEGKPQPWTAPILLTLERVLEINPNHPGANHYYVHAVEASPEPHKAVAAAERLQHLVPDASHLVHMPGHIFVRVGRWEDAARANIEAMQADRLYRAAYPRPGFYGMYMAHNAHFLAFTAMMRGRSEETIRIARRMVSEMPEDFVAEFPGVVDGYTVFVSKALMRFGKWEEILAEPEPPAGMPLARALWHFTRATAYTVLDRIPEARAERDAFRHASAQIPATATFGNNASSAIAEIASRVLDGEMAAQSGDFDKAIVDLEQAVQLEDKLRYDEPPDWVQPVRHTLGAVLLRAGKPAEAERVYREDLLKNPANGWSLMGLRDALSQQEKTAEARRVHKQFLKAWAAADVQPPSTCYCQPAMAAE